MRNLISFIWTTFIFLLGWHFCAKYSGAKQTYDVISKVIDWIKEIF